MPGRAAHGANLLQRTGVTGDLHGLFGGNDRRRRATRNDRFQCATCVQATGVLEDNLAQRNAYGYFVDPRALHIPTHTPQAYAAVALGTNAVVPCSTTFDNVAHIGQRFNVVHDSRHTEGPDVSGKWRFDPRVSALTFQRLDEPCLFATDIGAGPTVHEDIELHIRTQDIFAEYPAV